MFWSRSSNTGVTFQTGINAHTHPRWSTYTHKVTDTHTNTHSHKSALLQKHPFSLLWYQRRDLIFDLRRALQGLLWCSVKMLPGADTLAFGNSGSAPIWALRPFQKDLPPRMPLWMVPQAVSQKRPCLPWYQVGVWYTKSVFKCTGRAPSNLMMPHVINIRQGLYTPYV